MGNRVYEGRFKGNSECHGSDIRNQMDAMGEGMPSYHDWKCADCGKITKVHKLDRIFRCQCGSLTQQI